MKYLSYPLLDDDGKRKMLPGMANFGVGSYDNEHSKHTGVLSGKKIGKIYKSTRTSHIINKKVIVIEDTLKNFGFPIIVFEN